MIMEKDKKRNFKIGVCLAVVAVMTYCFAPISQAVVEKHHESQQVEKSSELPLSDDVKEILNQEMAAIQKGMMAMIPAIAAGHWEQIAKIAQQIKESFILKQKLTEEQIEELHRTLPLEFIEMDRGFHMTAEKLSHAAHKRDGELVNFYFYKLHNECMSCHATYAAERFPGLKNIQLDQGGHH